MIHIDEIIDRLLREERLCEVILPRMQKRYVLEENNVLSGPRVSPLELDAKEEDKVKGEEEDKSSGVKREVEKDYAFERSEDSGSREGAAERRRSRSRSRSLSQSSSSSSDSRREK